MMFFEIILLALLGVSHAAAEASTECRDYEFPRKVLCTATKHEQDMIMEFVKKGLIAKEAFEAASAVEPAMKSFALSANASLAIKESWSEMHSRMEEKEKEMRDNFEMAMALTRSFYGIAPETPKRGAWEPAVGGPMNDSKINWDPRFHHESSFAREYVGSDGLKHYLAATVDEDAGGTTLPTGEVFILPAMFESARDEGQPGPLALALDHEASHFKDLVSALSSLSKQQGEIRAYKSIERLNIFQLDNDRRAPGEKRTKIDWKAFYEGEIKKQIGEMRDGLERPRFDTPDEEETARKVFTQYAEVLQGVRDETARLKQDIESGRILQEQFISSLKAVARKACSVEGVSQFELDLLPYLSLPGDYPDSADVNGEDYCVGGIVAESLALAKQGRALESRAANKRAESLKPGLSGERKLRKLDIFAGLYGFKLIDINYAGYAYQSESDSRYHQGYARFRFNTWGDVFAGLFLLRSCINGEMASNAEDGLEVLREFAADPAFRKRINPIISGAGPGGGANAGNCIDYLLQNPAWLTNEKDFKEILDFYMKAQQKFREEARKEAERYRRIQKKNEARDRANREKLDRERERSGNNIDLSPAEEALSRAKERAGRGLP